MYVNSFLKLAEYYNLIEDIESVKKWRNKALYLSERANDEDLIKKIAEMKW